MVNSPHITLTLTQEKLIDERCSDRLVDANAKDVLCTSIHLKLVVVEKFDKSKIAIGTGITVELVYEGFFSQFVTQTP
jgi:hypothetical protein